MIGMTQFPEATLAREAELCFANVALVTDYDVGVDGIAPVSHHEVLKVFGENIEALRDLLVRRDPGRARRARMHVRQRPVREQLMARRTGADRARVRDRGRRRAARRPDPGIRGDDRRSGGARGVPPQDDAAGQEEGSSPTRRLMCGGARSGCALAPSVPACAGRRSAARCRCRPSCCSGSRAHCRSSRSWSCVARSSGRSRLGARRGRWPRWSWLRTTSTRARPSAPPTSASPRSPRCTCRPPRSARSRRRVGLVSAAPVRAGEMLVATRLAASGFGVGLGVGHVAVTVGFASVPDGLSPARPRRRVRHVRGRATVHDARGRGPPHRVDRRAREGVRGFRTDAGHPRRRPRDGPAAAPGRSCRVARSRGAGRRHADAISERIAEHGRVGTARIDSPAVTILQAIILGIVQGVTEFAPISSSGHLILVPWAFGWDIVQDPALNKTFDVALHMGTLLGAIVYFRDRPVAIPAGVHRLVPSARDPHHRRAARVGDRRRHDPRHDRRRSASRSVIEDTLGQP